MEETKSKEEAAIDQINPSSYDRSHLVSDAPSIDDQGRWVHNTFRIT